MSKKLNDKSFPVKKFISAKIGQKWLFYKEKWSFSESLLIRHQIGTMTITKKELFYSRKLWYLVSVVETRIPTADFTIPTISPRIEIT